MRIAIDCRKAGDFGIGTYIRGLLGGLSETDHDDEFLLLVPDRVRESIPDDARFRLVPFDAPHYSVREIFSLGRAAEAAGAALLHVPHYIAPVTRLPLVTTIHDVIHLKLDRRQLPLVGRSYARWMIGRACRKSQRIIVPTRAVAEDVASHAGAAAEKTRVVPEAADARFFGPAPETTLLARFGLEPRQYVLFAGNDKPHKNVDALVGAFDRSAELQRTMRLALAGGVFDRFSGREFVRRCGFVSDRELHALYSHAAVLVMPSIHEGFGLPLLEAMACGTPVVISRSAALQEVAGGAAIVSDESDPGSIASAILEAIEKRPRLSVAGRERAAMFSWRATATATLQIYREAASQK